MKKKKKLKRWQIISDLMSGVPAPQGVEVGVYFGEMSEQLLRLMPGLRLWMIDRWESYTAYEGTRDAGAGISQKPLEHFAEAEAAARRVVSKYPGTKVLKGDSLKMAGMIPDKSCDFVFIDGDHSYGGALADTLLYLPKVKPGGYLTGHDCDRRGVKKALMAMQTKGYNTDKSWRDKYKEYRIDSVWIIQI